MSDNTQAEEIPLIYTSKGNIPIAGLKAEPKWDFDETGITFSEEYYDGDELVKRSAHRFQFPDGTTLRLQQGAING